MFVFSFVVFSLIFSAQRSGYNTIIKSSLGGYIEPPLLDTSYGLYQQPTTGIIYGFDYDMNSDFLYYGDRGHQSIWKVPLVRLSSSSDDRILVVRNTTAWDLTVDWINGYLYWTDDRYVRTSIYMYTLIFLMLRLFFLVMEQFCVCICCQQKLLLISLKWG